MRFEYKTVKVETGGLLGGKLDDRNLNGMLNELGREGWELVTALDTNMGAGTTRDIVAIFKRQL